MTKITNEQVKEAANMAERLWPAGVGHFIARELRAIAAISGLKFDNGTTHKAILDIWSQHNASLSSSKDRVSESTS